MINRADCCESLAESSTRKADDLAKLRANFVAVLSNVQLPNLLFLLSIYGEILKSSANLDS
jgi:hypothetical protein